MLDYNLLRRKDECAFVNGVESRDNVNYFCREKVKTVPSLKTEATLMVPWC